MADNYLYYSDNLDILGRYVAAESMDLASSYPVYDGQQACNASYEERPGVASCVQFKSFEETWERGAR